MDSSDVLHPFFSKFYRFDDRIKTPATSFFSDRNVNEIMRKLNIKNFDGIVNSMIYAYENVPCCDFRTMNVVAETHYRSIERNENKNREFYAKNIDTNPLRDVSNYPELTSTRTNRKEINFYDFSIEGMPKRL